MKLTYRMPTFAADHSYITRTIHEFNEMELAQLESDIKLLCSGYGMKAEMYYDDEGLCQVHPIGKYFLYPDGPECKYVNNDIAGMVFIKQTEDGSTSRYSIDLINRWNFVLDDSVKALKEWFLEIRAPLDPSKETDKMKYFGPNSETFFARPALNCSEEESLSLSSQLAPEPH